MLARLPATHLPLRAPTCVGRSVPLRRSKGVNSGRQEGRLDGFVSNPNDQLTGSAANLPNFSEDYGKGLYSLSVRVPIPTPPGHLGLKRGSGDSEAARASSEIQLVSNNYLFSFPVCHLRGLIGV